MISRILFLLGVALAPCLAAEPAEGSAWLGELAERLQSHYGLEGEVQVLPVSGGSSFPIQGAQITVLEFPAVISPQIILRLRAEGVGIPAVEQTVALRVHVWRMGWKTRQPVQRGDFVDAATLLQVRLDGLREREAMADLPSGDFIFTRAVPPGRLVTWRDVAARPIIRRGQLVEVVAQSGPVSVSMKAMAMQDGARLEMIRIRNIQSNREFTAQVIAENRALVTP